MADFFGSEVSVSADQAAIIARGLFSLANVDGRVEREGMLIQSLWMDAVGSEKISDLKQLERMPNIGAEELKAALTTPELRELFMRTAILLAYADSNYSPKEREWVKKTGTALGVAEKDLAKMDDQVRHFLLSQLTDVANTDATRQVAKKLGF
ncbi:MAG TPA: hypothetical protein VMV18_05035 [bacterium]|nr:hypothetical protein [bacterium]